MITKHKPINIWTLTFSLPPKDIITFDSAAATSSVSFLLWDSSSTFKPLTFSNSAFKASTSDCRFLIKLSLTSSFSISSFLLFPSGSSLSLFIAKSPTTLLGLTNCSTIWGLTKRDTTLASSASLPLWLPTTSSLGLVLFGTTPLLILEVCFNSGVTDLALLVTPLTTSGGVLGGSLYLEGSLNLDGVKLLWSLITFFVGGGGCGGDGGGGGGDAGDPCFIAPVLKMWSQKERDSSKNGTRKRTKEKLKKHTSVSVEWWCFCECQ